VRSGKDVRDVKNGMTSFKNLVSRFDSSEHFLEEVVAHGVDLNGNLLEVHVYVSFGRIHPEAWRRWTRC